MGWGKTVSKFFPFRAMRVEVEMFAQLRVCCWDGRTIVPRGTEVKAIVSIPTDG